MANLVGAAVSAALLAAAWTASASADAIVLQPHGSVGQQAYELEFTDVTQGNAQGGLFFRDGFKVRDDLTFYGGGLGLTAGRFFADVSGQWSQEGHYQTQIFQGTALPNNFPLTTSSTGHLHRLDAKFDRQELNVTVGWGVTPEFSAYIGYKRASLDMTQARSPVLSPAPDFGDVLQLGNYLMEFNYNGYFVGATYSLPVGSWGAFSFQSSVASLDSTFKQHFDGAIALYTPFGAVFADPAFITGKTDGDSVGFNLGVSWTGHFGWASESLQRLSYTIGVDRSQYQFDVKHSSQGGDTSDFNEKNTRIRLDLRYAFQIGD